MTTDKKVIYQTYINILKKELVPAMGCTEPIAIAYCAAKAACLLGEQPEEIEILASGNIIKNVKSVIVPNANGLRGLETAAALGALFGKAENGLEVIATVTEEQAKSLKSMMEKIRFTVEPLQSSHVLDMQITLRAGKHSAMVHIEDEHTNVVEMQKDGKVVQKDLEEQCAREEKEDTDLDYSLLRMEDIFTFANEEDLAEVIPILDRQITYNEAIVEEGLKHKYGACIGQVLLHQDNSVRTRAKARAAAGSDARMSGCELPVVINSGSGNQGLTASIPVITYAKEYEKSQEELYRALLVSNLVTLHLKSGIGRLSAYCGAVSAGAGAGAGIAYLMTKDLKVINHTLVNALAVTSGIVCDGAKASCAAKIAMAVESGILGFEMYLEGNEFCDGDGLVSKGVENTIENISKLGNEGMKDTDRKIIEIMTQNKRCF